VRPPPFFIRHGADKSKCSVILTILQIDEAASDPLTRSTALLGLVCAPNSLGFGALFIVRFGGHALMFKASRRAEDA
jgi:hypothetical protein